MGPKHQALWRSAAVVIAALALGVLTANAQGWLPQALLHWPPSSA
jgi:hypothetical protein